MRSIDGGNSFHLSGSRDGPYLRGNSRSAGVQALWLTWTTKLVNFQVTVLKILVSYPSGFATLTGLKRDMAILATSGPEWSARTRRLGARLPELDIFSQALIERRDGGWAITDKGRAALAFMEEAAQTARP